MRNSSSGRGIAGGFVTLLTAHCAVAAVPYVSLPAPLVVAFYAPSPSRVPVPVHAGVAQFVRRAFEDSISGILNKRQVDVLHDIKRKRAKGES